ncbi:MAG: hypothetical protein ACYDHW_01940 [Syntrophorhabdaceae bacterium]
MSDKIKFVCEPATSSGEWDQIVNASPQGTLFSESLYLAACGCDHEKFVIRQGQQIKAGLSVTYTEDRKRCGLDDLVIHNGLMFIPDTSRKSVRARIEQFEITEFIVDFLDNRFDAIKLALAPGFEDMRPFLWHNYHDPVPSRRFILNLRYTSYINISSLKGCDHHAFEQSECFRAMETLRQRHIRQAYRREAKINRVDSTARLIAYYRALMERQNDPVPENKLARMETLINTLLAEGKASVYEVHDHSSEVIYTVVYGWDHKRAYYLFGAGHPEINEPFQGTFAHWGAFMDLANSVGKHEVDLEGVNSPQRGWFKLSLGGDLRPYYHVCKGRQ